MIGGTTSKDAMKRVLQKLFTNNLASKCSWTGAKNNFKLKDLKMIICMKSKLHTISFIFVYYLISIFDLYYFLINKSYIYPFFRCHKKHLFHYNRSTI